jgi:MFS family permease
MSHFKDRIDLFKNKSFRNYVISCTMAMFGNGLTYIAMTWLLVRNNNQVAAVAILMTCFWLPTIVLGPMMGVVVDKFDRKKILQFCNLSRAIILSCFWLLFQGDPPDLAIYMLSLLTGCVLALYIPAAMTLVREVVDKKDLLYANASVDMAYEIGAVTGMGASGLIMALTSVHTTFLINAICYFFATITLCLVQSKQRKPEHMSVWSDFVLGMRYLLNHPRLQVIYLIQMFFFVSYMTAPILLAPYARSVLHANAGEFGYIEASMSIGAVIGGIISPFLSEKIGFIKILVLETTLCALSFWAFGHNLYLPYAILWYFFIGFCFSAWPLLITAAQDQTEMAYQGRVQSVFNSLSGLLILLFYLLLTLVGDGFNIGDLYWIEVVLMLVSIVFLLVYRNKSTPAKE